MRLFIILFPALIFSGVPARESGGCCYKRIVLDYKEGLEGEFTFTRAGAQDPICADGCVYRRYDKGTFPVSRDRLILSGLETLRRKNTVLKLSMTELLIFERNVMLYLHHLH